MVIFELNMHHSQQLGQWAEQYASQYVEQLGFNIVQRNYHCRGGELDLIINKDKLLVFIEVKARSSQEYGSAVEMLTPNKQKRMMKAITHFLHHFPQYDHYDYRFDLFAIQIHSSHNIAVEWIENAFLWQDIE